VREAEDPSTAHAGAALQQVDAPAALVTVGRQFGVAEDAEFRHGPRDVPLHLIIAAWVDSKGFRLYPAGCGRTSPHDLRPLDCSQ
jgi:hypothetical protein